MGAVNEQIRTLNAEPMAAYPQRRVMTSSGVQDACADSGATGRSMGRGAVARSGVVVDTTIACAGVQGGVVTDRLVQVLADHPKYKTVGVGANRLQFARTFHPTWALVTGVVLLPVVIGVFFLLIKVTETCTAIVDSDHAGTRVRLSGRLDRQVLDELSAALFEAADPSAGSLIAPATDVVPAVPQLLAPPPRSAAGSIVPNAAGPSPSPSVPVVPAGPGSSEASPPPLPPLLAPAEKDDSATVVVRNAGPPPLLGSDRVPVLRLDDGRRVEVVSRIHLGRAPVALDAGSDAELVSVEDETRSVSKTHLAAFFDGASLWVADLHSTNGSSVLESDGTLRMLEPGEWVPVGAGATLQMGEQLIAVELPGTSR